MPNGLEAIRKFTEPTVRAIRRGDAAQLAELGAKLESHIPRGVAGYDDGVASGYWQALAGAIEISVSRTLVDRRVEFVQSRKRLLSILHALGQRHWVAKVGGADTALNVSALAKATGVASQNLGALIDDLQKHDLVHSASHRQSRRTTITEEGLEVLAMLKPNWHVEPVVSANEIDWDAAFQRFMQSVHDDRAASAAATLVTIYPAQTTHEIVRIGQRDGTYVDTTSDFTFTSLFPRKAISSKSLTTLSDLGKSYSRVAGALT